jgi:hypothetical protein
MQVSNALLKPEQPLQRKTWFNKPDSKTKYNGIFDQNKARIPYRD